MDQQINQQFHAMGSLLMLDPPEGLQFGIDNISWKIGKMFKGLKMVPLGVHIVTYSLKQQNNMFKVSKFINFTNQKKVHVYKWDTVIGFFKQVKGEQADGYRHGVKAYHFDSYLGPYPKQNLNFWKINTSFITAEVLDKLDPIDPIQVFQQQYSNLIQPIPQHNQIPIDVIEQQNQQDQVERQVQEEIEKPKKQKNVSAIAKFKQLTDNIYYSEVPRRLKGQLQHISKINLDKSQILSYVTNQSWKKYPKGILGQIQYCFISFLIGQNQESFSQWKKLVNLFCMSQSQFMKQGELVMEFLIVLYQQLSQFPADFFRDELSKQNFLQQCLRKLKVYTYEEKIPKKVAKRIKKLLQMLENKFDFVVQTEKQDECPVVVELSESYF